MRFVIAWKLFLFLTLYTKVYLLISVRLLELYRIRVKYYKGKMSDDDRDIDIESDVGVFPFRHNVLPSSPVYVRIL